MQILLYSQGEWIPDRHPRWYISSRVMNRIWASGEEQHSVGLRRPSTPTTSSSRLCMGKVPPDWLSGRAKCQWEVTFHQNGPVESGFASVCMWLNPLHSVKIVFNVFTKWSFKTVLSKNPFYKANKPPIFLRKTGRIFTSWFSLRGWTQPSFLVEKDFHWQYLPQAMARRCVCQAMT